MKLVSVVVVTYNSSSTVLETLDSTYDQTYSPLELIVSDDHSKDDTIRVVKNWIESHKERFADVRILTSPENTGVTRNCNRGIFAAKGEYIQLIAGDDILLPTCIEEKTAFAEREGLNWVVSKTEPFGPESDAVEKMKQFCERGYDIIAKGYKEQVDAIIHDNYIAGPSGGFFNSEYFSGIGGFDCRYPMVEDYPFIYHYLMAGNEIVLLDKVLSRYRITGTSLCTAENSPSYKSQRKFFYRERMWKLLKKGQFRFVIYKICVNIYQATLKRLLHR